MTLVDESGTSKTERRKDAYERVFRAIYEKASRVWAAGSSVFQR